MDLNANERSILVLLHRDVLTQEGPHDDAQIADELSLTQEAVKAHLPSLYEKLRLPRLTEAERRVVIVLCRPLRQDDSPTTATNRQVANTVCLAEDTVKAHLGALYEKFGLGQFPHNQKRARLAERILQSGLLSTPAQANEPASAAPPPVRLPSPLWTRRLRHHRAIPLAIFAILAVGALLVVWTPWQNAAATHAVCSDRRDNDQDGKTDLNDSGCSFAADTSEEKDPPAPPGVTHWHPPLIPNSRYHCGGYSHVSGGMRFQACVIVRPTRTGADVQSVLAVENTGSENRALSGTTEALLGRTRLSYTDCGTTTIAAGARQQCFSRTQKVSGHGRGVFARGFVEASDATSPIWDT